MYKTIPQISCMTAPFKVSIQTEPKPEIDIVHYSRKWIPSRNLCAALCTVKKTTTKQQRRLMIPSWQWYNLRQLTKCKYIQYCSAWPKVRTRRKLWLCRSLLLDFVIFVCCLAKWAWTKLNNSTAVCTLNLPTIAKLQKSQ